MRYNYYMPGFRVADSEFLTFNKILQKKLTMWVTENDNSHVRFIL